MTTLFDPVRLGDIHASNRIVMAPLTRNRAGPGQVPTELMCTYYQQRCGAGLIVSEATQVSPAGQGYLDTPGIYSVEQRAGWRRVTDAVHARGGAIVLQLWHAGRVSHVSLQANAQSPVSSTARRAAAKTYTAAGFESVSEPRALRLDELPGIVKDYRHAAIGAIDAGFDGVEIHAAHGYLLDQFLRDSINDRTDSHGGPPQNRIRLPLAVITAVATAIGPGRTGLHLSPVTTANDAGQDSDAQGLFGHFIEQLAPLELAYIHMVEGTAGGPRDAVPFDYAALRERFKRGRRNAAWIANNGYTRALATEAVASGTADLISFGRLFVSNPDLVARLRADAPLAKLNSGALYGGGAAGYTDYPALDPANAPVERARAVSVADR